MNSNEQLQELLQKYLNRQCSADEVRMLLKSFNLKENENTLKAAILQYFSSESDTESSSNQQEEANTLEQVHAKLMLEIRRSKTRANDRAIMWQRAAAAASILIIFSLGIFFYYGIKNIQKQEVVRNQPKPANTNWANDVEPGGNKGTLTLADGSNIALESMADGSITRQGDVRVKKENNQLVYESSMLEGGKVIYNRVTIPRGGQYQLTLPDGTKVWMNAGSVIAYPVVFNRNERRVSIKGEAYFEVAAHYYKDHDGVEQKQPFVVSANQEAEVRVLGTHFNIKAYPGEGSVKTTLLEGSVEVKSTASSKSILIQPGQQAAVAKDGTLSVAQVNTEEVIAWKNGYFYFDNTSLQEVLLQLARWYDVQVLYEGAIPNRHFTGKIRRNIYLSEALEILNFTKVNFRIEGRKIIVTP